MKQLIAAFLFYFSWANLQADTTTPVGIEWRQWSPEVWRQAKQENKAVYLYLQAVWCHWCHVMEATTFQDKEVITRLNTDFIPVKVDHDARPDLANKYRDYGWPANIILAPNGGELLQRAGHIPAEKFLPILQDFAVVPTRELVAKSGIGEQDLSPNLSSATRNRLLEKHTNSYDRELGGLAIRQKFLDGDGVEFHLLLAKRGDKEELARAKQSLTAAAKLVDPVWGGAYQYSTFGNWDNPHYEKLMRTQGRYLRVYSLAYEQLQNDEYRRVLVDIHRYLNNFLRDVNGSFYVSQDADLIQGQKAHDYFELSDVERRKQGIPKVDTHVYADANGQAIEGLALMAKALHDKTILTQALTAADNMINSLQNRDGGFRHSADHHGDYFLSDNLWMGRAFVALYKATDDLRWLSAAQKIALVIEQHFRAQPAGFAGGVDNGTPVKPIPNMDENIALGRFAAELYAASQFPPANRILRHCMLYLANPEVALSRVSDAGILLLDEAWREMSSD